MRAHETYPRMALLLLLLLLLGLLGRLALRSRLCCGRLRRSQRLRVAAAALGRSLLLRLVVVVQHTLGARVARHARRRARMARHGRRNGTGVLKLREGMRGVVSIATRAADGARLGPTPCLSCSSSLPPSPSPPTKRPSFSCSSMVPLIVACKVATRTRRCLASLHTVPRHDDDALFARCAADLQRAARRGQGQQGTPRAHTSRGTAPTRALVPRPIAVH